MIVETEVRPDLQEWVLPKELDPSDSGEQTLIERGYNPEFEAQRARLLYQALGEEGLRIAKYEQVNNREAYIREFLEDEPLSRPRIYWHYGDELYSYPHRHDLMKVSTGIDEDERDGKTLEGFKQYEQLVTDGLQQNDVVMWYSPAGPGGDVEPFNKLFYEAGRLYIAFKLSDDSSVHFDIKVQEGENIQFPIRDALRDYSGSNETDLYVYLQNPFLIDSQTFFHNRLDPSTPLYMSRRKSDDAQLHTWGEVLQEMRAALKYVSLDRETPALRNAQDIAHDEMYSLMNSQAIDQGYREDIWFFADENGLDEVMLYGCSTTSIVGMERQDPTQNTSTQFSTAARLTDAKNITSVEGDSHKNQDRILCCKCPYCNKQVEAHIKDGKITCPSCKVTVEWQDEE